MSRDKGFGDFSRTRRSDLARISRATRGEYSFNDVAGEAYVLGAGLAASSGRDLDFGDPAFQEELLARLYLRLVRHAEKNVRYAAKLDHATVGGDGEENRPFIERLAAPDGDPLAALEAAEDSVDNEVAVNPHESTASAYVVLLRAFDNRMGAGARYLLISPSHAYRRVARARLARSRQCHMATTLESGLFPRPWRRFRWYRIPDQLEFDFGERLAFNF